MQTRSNLMARVRTRFDLYSQTISNSAVSDIDAEPDPGKRFRKYAYTITNSEQAAIEAQFKEADTPEKQATTGQTVAVHLDAEVVEFFRKAGGDWKRRINEALRASLKLH
ncbi:MAG: BrnA antitoxin family protein [Roseibium sp.]|uniref:BrnA antitoxin family protein n=1 Tax=Roseibium sp. TaxID=1936156 RepID=UPI00261D965F|nr:BrnA antitoxin family protein [Roseibium sp.]MCV0427198.1 BrnA antitoxin family protein [Roseibium sp.]